MKKLFVLFLALIVFGTFSFSKYDWVQEGESFFLLSVNGTAHELSFLIPRDWKPVGKYYNTNNWLFVTCGDNKLRAVRLRRSGSAYMNEYRFEIEFPSGYGSVSSLINKDLSDDQIGVRFSNGVVNYYQVTPENGIEFLYKK